MACGYFMAVKRATCLFWQGLKDMSEIYSPFQWSITALKNVFEKGSIKQKTDIIHSMNKVCCKFRLVTYIHTYTQKHIPPMKGEGIQQNVNVYMWVVGI